MQEAEATAAPDVINVPAGKYKLTRTGVFETAATGDPTSPRSHDRGAGVGVTIIQEEGPGVRHLGDPIVAINNLTVTKGAIVKNVPFPPEDLDGGGISILFDAVVTLTDVALVRNRARDDGGGIANGATLSMNRVTVEKNKARDDAGGVYTFVGTSTLTNVTIAKNSAGDQGGAMEVQSSRRARMHAQRQQGQARRRGRPGGFGAADQLHPRGQQGRQGPCGRPRATAVR